MAVEEYLDELYQKVSDSSDAIGKAGFAYSIIEIKRENPAFRDYGKSAYVDVKSFVDCYITGVALDLNGDYGYDAISLDKILNALDLIKDINQRVVLYDKTLNLLKSYSMSDISGTITQERKKYKLIQCFSEGSLVSWIRGFLYFTVYNVWTVLGVLFLAFCSFYVITLPVEDEQHALFVIEHQEYCKNLFVNHFLTYFASVLDLTDKTFCKANGFVGFIVLMVFKLFFILFGGWNAVDIIKEKLSLSDGSNRSI